MSAGARTADLVRESVATAAPAGRARVDVNAVDAGAVGYGAKE
jgi:hypothetical protein